MTHRACSDSNPGGGEPESGAMIYATSDIHGYPSDLFRDLLTKAGFGPSDHLYVIGDVIDRNGDGGVAMLRWMMRQPNVTLLLMRR